MKLLIGLSVFILSITNITAQEIIGNVYLQSSGWTGVEGIQVNGTGSNGDLSKGMGEFTLKFNNLKFADVVDVSIGNGEIAIDKKGNEWELVNLDKLENVAIPNNSSDAPLKIIICPKGQTHQVATNYYKPIKKNVDEQRDKLHYERNKLIEDVKNLKKRYGEKYDEVLEKEKIILEKEKTIQQYEKNNDSLKIYNEALKYARINRDDSNDRINKYLDALNAGVDIEEARKELNLEKAKEEASQKTKGFSSNIDEIEIEISNLLKELKFTEAIHWYNVITELLINDEKREVLIAKNIREIAYLLASINRDQEAIQYYDQTLEMLKETISKESFLMKADVLNMKGVSLKNIRKYDDSESCHLEALNIYKTKFDILALENRFMVSNIQNNLALIYEKQNKTTLAIAMYEEILNTTKKLITDKNTAYDKVFELRLALVEGNLGLLYSENGSFIKAEELILKSISRYEVAAKLIPDYFAGDLSRSYDNLALVYINQQKYDLAKKNALVALSYLDSIEVDSPKYKPQFAFIFRHLGDAYLGLKNYNSAEESYLKSIEIEEELTLLNPIRFSEYLAFSYNSLANIYEITQRYSEAETNYINAINAYKNIELTNPINYKFYSANIYNNLGILSKNTGEFNKAKDYYDNSLDIKMELYSINPDRFTLNVTETIINILSFNKSFIEQKFDESIKKQSLKLIKTGENLLNEVNEVNPRINGILNYLEIFGNYFSQIDRAALDDQKVLLKEIAEIMSKIDSSSNSQKFNFQKTALDKALTFYSSYNFIPESKMYLSQIYGTLSFFAILNREFKYAQISAEKGLELDDSQTWILTNLALAYLFQDEYKSAEKLYVLLKDQNYQGTSFKSAFLNDFSDLEKEGISHPDIEKIKAILNN